ncbi:MAG: SDR family oxidoreductase [Phycisphaerae bacterium]|nr:SDR family oxidoreductase [Phycisphaerae bacterium]
MKVLFIGGTGNISTAVSRLAVERGVDLHLLNRGHHKVDVPGAKTIIGDIHKKDEVAEVLKGHRWDAVVNWIAFAPGDIERDIALFAETARQYIFISSASVYQKPPSHPVITESTPLANSHWEYSRNKIACEEMLNRAYREQGFAMTIVRPSLTYDTVIPLAFGGWTDYTIVDRMRKGGKVVVPGDGTSLWTVTHSEDFAKGFVGLLGHQQAVGHAFHITSDELLTWDQIYQAVAEAVGVDAKIVHVPSDLIVHLDPGQEGTLLGDKSHSAIFDNSKIKTFVPGYRATIPFRAGIKRTIARFEADPQRSKVNEESNRRIDAILDAYRKVFPLA